MYLPKGKTKKKRRYKTRKKIEIFEKAMNEGGSLKDYGINSTLLQHTETARKQETIILISTESSGITTFRKL